jgi:predicted RNase H-like HicB family nuclease
MKHFKIVTEKHPDGYVAYPIGVVGAIVGQGNTYEEALSDVKSAIACYAEVFCKEKLDDTPYIIDTSPAPLSSRSTAFGISLPNGS